jgi:hypothetical protein
MNSLDPIWIPLVQWPMLRKAWARLDVISQRLGPSFFLSSSLSVSFFHATCASFTLYMELFSGMAIVLKIHLNLTPIPHWFPHIVLFLYSVHGCIEWWHTNNQNKELFLRGTGGPYSPRPHTVCFYPNTFILLPTSFSFSLSLPSLGLSVSPTTFFSG